ncbi:hypothetical protein PGAL8A_00188100 [Plasmodium gallinaceum]|uniref:Uncharacterized protein n=1 Tax=Plasmodium gallinaceum TaxID=5849 RepID=A0A1J1GTW6_PLAGA|nr:hypothetical protein PGAL8A_00188100 [Plasmodium gallinaceum]CRG94486.1 hypothetical protein PGAL8A_00188100 [Plasmodium gallinaceum]
MEPEKNHNPFSTLGDEHNKNSYVTIHLNDQDNCAVNFTNLCTPNNNEIPIQQNVISNNSPEKGVYIRNNGARDYIESFSCGIAFCSALLFFAIRHLFLGCYRGLRRLKRERFDNNNGNSEQKSLTSNVNNEQEQ